MIVAILFVLLLAIIAACVGVGLWALAKVTVCGGRRRLGWGGKVRGVCWVGECEVCGGDGWRTEAVTFGGVSSWQALGTHSHSDG